jgi:hypothetical protein
MKISQKALDIFLAVMFFLSLVLMAITIIMQESRMAESDAAAAANENINLSAKQQEQQVQSGDNGTSGQQTAEAATPIDTSSWTTYDNETIGFSLMAPKEVYSDGSRVPLRINGDKAKKAIDINYDAGNVGVIGWSLKFAAVNDDKGLDAFINSMSSADGHGVGCHLGDKEVWDGQEGVYSVKIKGDDWDNAGTNIGNSTCVWNSVYSMLYYPAKNIVMAVNMGQEALFYGRPDSSIAYDGEIAKSFRFK